MARVMLQTKTEHNANKLPLLHIHVTLLQKYYASMKNIEPFKYNGALLNIYSEE